ncbi:hypothetical protein NDU88_005290 [Pleurodeles waltl]|uniref:Uncharacterized protein n=1 Tax=Pleurodeles waltl TaxID=8319 RepID=A0AAV7PGG8_PLEWA|nr:hypothetical protein NDU88_005290 [Pleurodeles waltl]
MGAQRPRTSDSQRRKMPPFLKTLVLLRLPSSSKTKPFTIKPLRVSGVHRLSDASGTDSYFDLGFPPPIPRGHSEGEESGLIRPARRYTLLWTGHRPCE